MRLDINTDAYLLLTIIHSSKVFLTWGSRAGFTNEEPGTGEPEPAQRCVTALIRLQNSLSREPTRYYVCPLVVENMKAALQKLESRVAVLEKAPAAVPCAKVGD